MFSKLWGHIKGFFKGLKNFFKKHFHKVAAVTTAGFTMITLEIIGLLAVDTLLFPIATISLIGTILLYFGYFLVIYSAITVGMTIFEYIWNNFDLNKEKIETAGTTNTVSVTA